MTFALSTTLSRLVLTISLCALPLCAPPLLAQVAVPPATATPPRFRVLVLAEQGGQHGPFVLAAEKWLAAEAAREHFAVDEISDTSTITGALLAQHRVVFQLNYPPYNWTPTAQAAFTRYIDEGLGGWVGLHHSTLLGEFDGFPIWPWFQDFMGGIRFQSYIPDFASAVVHNEQPSHPVMRGLPSTFPIDREEWYTWDRSPRPNVDVLATVDESTYSPPRPQKMGPDHPVIWSNPHKKARNVYIFMGHGPWLFANPDYTRLLHNSLLWAAGVSN